MINMFAIMGRVESITDEYVQIYLPGKNQNELHVRAYLVGSDTFKSNLKTHLEINCIVAVKGSLGVVEGSKELKLIGEKFTFLGKSGEISDTKGEEIEDE